MTDPQDTLPASAVPADVAAPAAAPTPAEAPPVAPADMPPIAPAEAPPAPFGSRRLHLLAGLRWLVARLFAIALFVGGLALGYSAFLADQPEPTVVVDPATAGVATPTTVEEFITALTSNQPDALRSAVAPEPYQLLIAEMDRWGFVSITKVETLSTYADGPRSATELVMTGTTTAGVPVTVNLVVHVAGGQIVSFR